MQTYSRDGVRQERTGWRDMRMSLRHKTWGFDCPGVDIDFVMVEYNIGVPVGLVEYKHYRARIPDLRHPSYQALSKLADGYEDKGLPFLIAFYWPNIWAFRVIPVNQLAKKHFSENEELSEYDFVAKLYLLRRLALRDELDKVLNRFAIPKDGDHGIWEE